MPGETPPRVCATCVGAAGSAIGALCDACLDEALSERLKQCGLESLLVLERFQQFNEARDLSESQSREEVATRRLVALEEATASLARAVALERASLEKRRHELMEGRREHDTVSYPVFKSLELMADEYEVQVSAKRRKRLLQLNRLFPVTETTVVGVPVPMLRRDFVPRADSGFALSLIARMTMIASRLLDIPLVYGVSFARTGHARLHARGAAEHARVSPVSFHAQPSSSEEDRSESRASCLLDPLLDPRACLRGWQRLMENLKTLGECQGIPRALLAPNARVTDLLWQLIQSPSLGKSPTRALAEAASREGSRRDPSKPPSRAQWIGGETGSMTGSWFPADFVLVASQEEEEEAERLRSDARRVRLLRDGRRFA